ncbi:MAG TPA: hypothetical protein VIK85_00490 [Coriobacteriia bacterium]
MTAARPGVSPADLVNFTWRRLPSPTWQTVHKEATEELNEDGEVICSTDASDGRIMVGAEGEAYEPLKEAPALFRTYAALEDTEDAYLDFARRYGRLWAPTTFFEGLLFTDASGGLGQWRYSRRALADAVRLWDELRHGSTAELFHRAYEMRPLGDALGVYSKFDERPRTAFVDKDGTYWGESEPVIVVPDRTGERGIIQSLLRRQLTQTLTALHVSLTLAPTEKAYGAGLRLTYVVYTLEAAMWLQLALAIDGNREYATCPVCGKWWDRTDARAHKEVCSDKCRAKRSYQERQKAKRQLEGKGKS